jgi:threonine/homoserine/homoserine lactone efflux protein
MREIRGGNCFSLCAVRRQNSLMDSRLLAFVAISGLLIIVPGPDMALVARNAFRGGWRSAWPTALGVGVGIAGWGVASVVGLAALLAASAVAFTVVKLAGAGYLLYLGLNSLRAGLQSPDRELRPPDPAPIAQRRVVFQQGLLGNLLNPKAAAIFVTVIPQFIRPGDPPARLVIMLVLFELMLIAWLGLYGYLVGRAGQSRVGLSVRRALQTVSGLVLIGFAARLATESR